MTIGNLAKGLAILAKHTGENSYNVGAEHDVLLVGPEVAVSADDEKALTAMGWFVNDDGSWQAFV